MIKVLIGFLAACFLSTALAKPFAKVEFNGATLTLHDTKCELFPEGFHAVYQDSTKSMKACWAYDEKFVYVIYEDKDQGTIPRNAFKPVVYL